MTTENTKVTNKDLKHKNTYELHEGKSQKGFLNCYILQKVQSVYVFNMIVHERCQETRPSSFNWSFMAVDKACRSA